MNQHIREYLRLLVEHMEYYNYLAPFPVFDTEYIEDVRNKFKQMEEEDKINYDELPVIACKYCKSLHIVDDEIGNGVCFRCGNINDFLEFKNIHEYNIFANNGRNK